jgi:hypothetical protein
MRQGVRGSLVGLAIGLGAVFGVAFWLDPYDSDGTARRLATHRQLGLPPCSFLRVTGLPCPTCGMTTSFALLVRGDVANSLRANAVGTLLAGFCLLLIPWCLASACAGRTLFVRSLERAGTIVILIFLGLAVVRWALVVSAVLWRGTPFGD